MNKKPLTYEKAVATRCEAQKRTNLSQRTIARRNAKILSATWRKAKELHHD